MAKKRKFYKKKQRKADSNKLPSNSRTITDKLVNDHSVFFIGITCIAIAIVLVSYDFYNNLIKQEAVYEARGKVIEDLNFWNREVIEKPNYRDGYFNLALIYFQLGDIKNSSLNLEKALSLDPNFEEGKSFREILNLKHSMKIENLRL